jgi:surface antigen
MHGGEMMKNHLAFLILGGLLGGAFAQSNLGWLKDTPISKFSKADEKTMMDNLHTALDSGEDGVPVKWENPAASNSGSATPSPDPKGRTGCRAVRLENRHQTLYQSTDTVFCKVDGKWKLVQKN